QFEDFSESNNEVSSIDDDSFSIVNIDYVEASPPDFELVSSEVMEIVIPEVGGIDDDISLTIKDDNLREKLLNVHLLIANIEALKDNPTPSSESLTKSSSTSLNSFLEETNIFHNSLPKFENFYFDLGEISSGSTTTHSDISLSEYDSFIFEEFVDELAHIISPPDDDDSLHEENIEYVEASPHDSKLVSLEAAEIVIPEEEEIEDDNLREKLLNVHLLIANIEALKDNPTPSSKLLTKSSSTSLNSFLEETNTFHNYLPEFRNFYFDLGEISSGSTTTHSDISLSEYDSFIFDFAHEEFVDELAHIISPPEYDCFYFRNLPDPGELMFVLNFGIRENLPSVTSVNLPIEDDHSPILTYVVWIFLAYLTILGNLKTHAEEFCPPIFISSASLGNHVS
nr:hypothetical protein [Tanacetum cinerariifolium]